MQENQYLLNLVKDASTSGWQEALYNYALVQVRNGVSVTEDQRSADWVCLLPSCKHLVSLVVGCGLGTIPLTLAEFYEKVYVIDPVPEKIEFLNIRAQQQNIKNIIAEKLNHYFNASFKSEYFDLVSIKSMAECGSSSIPVITKPSFEDVASRTFQLLKKGGLAHFNIENRLSVQRLLRKTDAKKPHGLYTVNGYKRVLTNAGFSDIRIYSPLPHHEGIPMFYLPLDRNNMFDYFFGNIFRLFDMVSPEMKQQHVLEYLLAKSGVTISRSLGLNKILKNFFSGFMIITKK